MNGLCKEEGSSLRKRMREFRRADWSVEFTGGGHLKLSHPDTRERIYTASTPSDHRAQRKLRSQLRRALESKEEERHV
jgi:hypothetical protein